MKIQKTITLMGDRIYLTFFVDENNTFSSADYNLWFEDIHGNHINIGDSYPYFLAKENKKAIKKDLKQHFKGIGDDKGIYKELKYLLNEMSTYER